MVQEAKPRVLALTQDDLKVKAAQRVNAAQRTTPVRRRAAREVLDVTIPDEVNEHDEVSIDVPVDAFSHLGLVMLVGGRATLAAETRDTAVASALADSVQEFTEALSIRASTNMEFVATLLHDVSSALTSRALQGRALTQSQRDWVVESGAMTSDEIDQAESEIAGGALQRLQLRTQVSPLVDSLSTAEVAERLGIDETRVRHRVSGDLLCSWKAGRVRRYPKWQFADDGKTLLPGLSKIVKAIPEDLSAASVQRLMTSPQDDLLIDDEPTSPREWLLSGEDAEEVVELIEGIDS